ncbi:MAG: MBL fold metallo-hydrolase [Phycisphaerales bacterium]|nr:MBL fold metallo-hydrolase [Phycisphaerales bacterium]
MRDPVANQTGETTTRLRRFTLGPYQTNCYIVEVPNQLPGTTGVSGLTGSARAPCWVVDASFGPEPMIRHIREAGLELKALVLTHCHVDHIAGVEAVLKAFPGAELVVHEAERGWLTDPELNLSAFTGFPVTTRPANRVVREEDVLELGGAKWRVLHVPGHSPGSMGLYSESEGVAISGDALFAGSIGRTDFPGCSFEQLERSIRNKLYALPDATRVLPGHGAETTIGREKRSNPFVKAGSS